jgi:hypothetical protein
MTPDLIMPSTRRVRTHLTGSHLTGSYGMSFRAHRGRTMAGRNPVKNSGQVLAGRRDRMQVVRDRVSFLTR